MIMHSVVFELTMSVLKSPKKLKASSAYSKNNCTANNANAIAAYAILPSLVARYAFIESVTSNNENAMMTKSIMLIISKP
jgi:hypothetical protein